MTEFKRATQGVDEIESLVQGALDGKDPSAARRIKELLESTGPLLEKLRKKANETDSTKQTYGPQMLLKVKSLVERWDTLQGLATDVAANAPSAPAPTSQSTATSAAQPVIGSFTNATVRRPEPTPVPSHMTIEEERRRGQALEEERRRERREAQARAAEARAGTSAGPASSTKTSTAPASTSTAKLQASAEAMKSSPAYQVVTQMESLIHLVHLVFMHHGYDKEGSESSAACGGEASKSTSSNNFGSQGSYSIQYRHPNKLAPIKALYIPVQKHLMVYVQQGDAPPAKALVHLGMKAISVQSKVDYLLLYPLLYRHLVPELQSVPLEVTYGMCLGLTIPALGKVSCVSKGLAGAVMDDDVLWQSVFFGLGIYSRHSAIRPQSAGIEGNVTAGSWRKLVRKEIEAHVKEQNRRREMEEEMQRRERAMRNNPLMVQPPRRPWPHGGGFPTMGGDRDLMPGGGFMGDPFGGRRGPFGGGGPSYGGGGGGFFH